MQTTHYRITPRDPNAHVFEVQCAIEDPEVAGQRFRLPSWIAGSYLIREFARQFIAVRAEAAGAVVPIRKIAKDVWYADPTSGPLTVTASVYAFDLSVRTAYLDTGRAYFNGPSVFLCPEGRESAACTLDIVPPSGDAYRNWRVATTLDANGVDGRGFGRYGAADYDALIDHPVEIGDFALAAFTAGGVRHEVAITGRQDADLERLAADLRRVCQWHIELFGGSGSAPPFDRYLFQVTALGDGYGGLEHRSSTSLICRRDELPARGRPDITDNYLHFLGLASHEYFHAWNVKRIKPEAFTDGDRSRENYTRQLWAFEGITSYYDDLALVRSGLVAAPRYLELLGRTITSVLRTPGRHVQSIADSSFDAWIKFYRPDENAPNALISYYRKGALVALALDLMLRVSGRGSLDTVMRTLWTRYGERGVGVPEDGIEDIVSGIADGDVHTFFARYVHGTEDPPIDTLLAAFGIEWHLRAAANANDMGGKPASGPLPLAWFGARIGNDLTLLNVFSGGPAERAGLAPRDVIVAVDGIRASIDSIGALSLRRMAGETLHVHAFRGDEMRVVELELAAAPLDTCYLSLAEDATERAVMLRSGWLGSA